MKQETLEEFLASNKTAILERWFELTVDTYPVDSRKFLTSRGNRFANPVGASILEGLEGVYDLLVKSEGAEPHEFVTFLDEVIRIRAVQDFSPANAVGFVFLLKKAAREAIGKEIRESRLLEQVLAFESRIDSLALLSCNIYTQCREKLFEIRSTEIRNRTSRILERACQKYGMPQEWMAPEDGSKNSVT
jgi:RsbT co-antagonist protein rsbRD N-terminal domain